MQARRTRRITAAHGGSALALSKANEFPAFAEGRYEARLARNASETASALRLRHEVFRLELDGRAVSPMGIEYDAFDFKCRHLIVIDRGTGATVGTYRVNTLETAGSVGGFYSAKEFSIGDLPDDVLPNGVEIGRACIAKEHRNTKVLYLLFKALYAFLEESGKSYFFGCCSIFTRDAGVGKSVYRQLEREGSIHELVRVMPLENGISVGGAEEDAERIGLPRLFSMYLSFGARVCGPPMIDREFGTIDFFVLFDVRSMKDKHRRMFAR